RAERAKPRRRRCGTSSRRGDKASGPSEPQPSGLVVIARQSRRRSSSTMSRIASSSLLDLASQAPPAVLRRIRGQSTSHAASAEVLTSCSTPSHPAQPHSAQARSKRAETENAEVKNDGRDTLRTSRGEYLCVSLLPAW